MAAFSKCIDPNFAVRFFDSGLQVFAFVSGFMSFDDVNSQSPRYETSL